MPGTSIETLAAKNEMIDHAARGAGHEPSDIRRIANVNGPITGGPSEGFLHGPPAQWIDELTDLALTHGFDSFVLWSEGDVLAQTQTFAEIARAVRSEVERARG